MIATPPLRRLVVADIFGRTAALEALVAALPGVDGIVDPYGGEDRGFADEDEAYAAFQAERGMDGYTKHLRARVQSQASPVSLLGFSVGGAAAWQLPAGLPVCGALCFYPSQVRHRADCPPDFPIHVVLPASEAHFSVDALAARIARHDTVSVSHSGGQHGFMNGLSSHHDAQHSSAVVASLAALSPGACFSQWRVP